MKPLPTEYGQLVQELLNLAAIKRQPVNGTFELTSRCNLFCNMCYIRHSSNDCNIQKKELSASQWLSLAHQAVDNGMVFLLLTGGEVFLRPDFFQIYEPLTRMGLIITLFSNGTLITKAHAARLADSPPNRMEITIYGASANTYEKVTGVQGSYARCCAGIEELIKYHIPLGLKTTLTKANVGELRAMQQMANNWGVPFSAGWLLTRRGDGNPSDVQNCRLSANDCISLEADDIESFEEWSRASHRESSTRNNSNFNCQVGEAAFFITPTGKMNACLVLSQPEADPLEVGFQNAWEHLQNFVHNAPAPSQACFICDARNYCPRCPAWSFLETDTLTEPVPYLCEIAHKRKEKYEQSI